MDSSSTTSRDDKAPQSSGAGPSRTSDQVAGHASQSGPRKLPFGEVYRQLYVRYRSEGNLRQTLDRIQADPFWQIELESDQIQGYYDKHWKTLWLAQADHLRTQVERAGAPLDPVSDQSLPSRADPIARPTSQGRDGPKATGGPKLDEEEPLALPPSPVCPEPAPPLPLPRVPSPSAIGSAPARSPATRDELHQPLSAEAGPSRIPWVPTGPSAFDGRSSSVLTALSQLSCPQSQTTDSADTRPDRDQSSAGHSHTDRPDESKQAGSSSAGGRSLSSVGPRRNGQLLRPPSLPRPAPASTRDRSLDAEWCCQCGKSRRVANEFKPICPAFLSKVPDGHLYQERLANHCQTCAGLFHHALKRLTPDQLKTAKTHATGSSGPVKTVLDIPRPIGAGIDALEGRRNEFWLGDVNHNDPDTLSCSVVREARRASNPFARNLARQESAPPASASSSTPPSNFAGTVPSPVAAPAAAAPVPLGSSVSPPAPCASASSAPGPSMTGRPRRSTARIDYAEVLEQRAPSPTAPATPSEPTSHRGRQPSSQAKGKKRARAGSDPDFDAASLSSPDSAQRKKARNGKRASPTKKDPRRKKAATIHPKKAQRLARRGPPPPPSSDERQDENFCFNCGWARPVCPPKCPCKKWFALDDCDWFETVPAHEEYQHRHRTMCNSCIYQCFNGVVFNETTHPKSKSNPNYKGRLPEDQVRHFKFGLAKLDAYRKKYWMGDFEHDIEDWASLRDFQGDDVEPEIKAEGELSLATQSGQEQHEEDEEEDEDESMDEATDEERFEEEEDQDQRSSHASRPADKDASG